MMELSADALFVLVIPIGVLLCCLGVYTYRRWDELGVGAFSAFVCLLGLGALISGLTGLFAPPVVDTDEPVMPLWGQLALVFWGLSAVPWFIFSLQYTGRSTQIRWRTIGLLFVPFLGIAANILLDIFGMSSLVVLSLIGTVVFVYSLVLVILGATVIVRTTYQYRHLTLTQGGLLVAAPIGVFFGLNSLGLLLQQERLAVSVYVTSFGFAALVLGTALFRYDTFEWSPAVGTIGEREITREIDDLVFVVDDRDHVIKCNEAVVETLDAPRSAVLGNPLEELLGYEIEELQTQETITLDAVDGARRYDSRVSTVTDQHDRQLGVLVSLHDVTEHQLREQRLAVLNRVLRHNLRNKVEVVKGHAEVLGDEGENQHVSTIVDTADAIAELGQNARTIDQFVSHSGTSADVDLVENIEQILTAVQSNGSHVSVELDLPAAATVETTQPALAGALESAIDNAISYADSAVEIAVTEQPIGYQISIADDGPGIPDGELDCLNAGIETPLQHGTGLGLWQLKWAVTTMGGELEFDTSDGTTVTFTVPDQ